MYKVVSFFGERGLAFGYLNEKAAKYANSLGLQYEWIPQKPYNKESVISAMQHSDAAIIDIEPYDDSIFSKICGSIKIMVRFGVGYEAVDLAAASKRGIAIARTPGANTKGVAEMAITLILALNRRLNENQACVTSGNWAKNVSHETAGSVLGIIGFGAIGQMVARFIAGFGCEIIAYDPYPNTQRAGELNVRLTSIDEVFETADIITLHLPYTKETHDLVDAKMFTCMKETAVIINTSRGNIINEQALYEALVQKKIAGAALDVFVHEPLELSSPLIGLDNVVLTPHVSSQTYESLWRIYKMAIDTVSDFFAGKERSNILNPDYKNAIQ